MNDAQDVVLGGDGVCDDDDVIDTLELNVKFAMGAIDEAGQLRRSTMQGRPALAAMPPAGLTTTHARNICTKDAGKGGIRQCTVRLSITTFICAGSDVGFVHKCSAVAGDRALAKSRDTNGAERGVSELGMPHRF